MLTYQLLHNDNIVIVEPLEPLSNEDFQQLGQDVDFHLERTGTLKGLLVSIEKFPGWNSFGAFLKHVRFVRDHHRKIRRVALASDSALADIAPKFAAHFVNAEVRRFGYDEREKALAWLREDD
jgi:hypothetical protein